MAAQLSSKIPSSTQTKVLDAPTVDGFRIFLFESERLSIKDILGFKTLNQVQLSGDALYYPDWIDATPWLVYNISKPLIGNVETVEFHR